MLLSIIGKTIKNNFTCSEIVTCIVSERALSAQQTALAFVYGCSALHARVREPRAGSPAAAAAVASRGLRVCARARNKTTKTKTKRIELKGRGGGGAIR